MPSHSKAWWLGLHPNLGISTGSQLGPWDWGVLHVGSPLDGWIHWKSLKKNGWFGGTPIGNLHIVIYVYIYIYIYIMLYLYGLWIRLEKPPQISAQRMLERHPKHRPFPCATLGLADTIYLCRASTWWLFCKSFKTASSLTGIFCTRILRDAQPRGNKHMEPADGFNTFQ